jgi:hypothetical protein
MAAAFARKETKGSSAAHAFCLAAMPPALVDKSAVCMTEKMPNTRPAELKPQIHLPAPAMASPYVFFL